ncbi:MAG: FecCD family ABC transporter permease [Lactococcus sp.]
MRKIRFISWVAGLTLVIVVLSVLYLMLGDKNYPLSALTTNPIVLQLRLPRLMSLFLAGFLLSVSGFLVQLMTRNPIAEMSTLGISGGASVGLAVLLAFGFSTDAAISTGLASIMAFVSLFIVMILTARTHFQPLKVALVGTSVGLFATSLASAITFAKHDSQAYFLWIVGSFSGVTTEKVKLLAVTVALFLLILFFYGSRLRMLALGDDLAKSLGVSVNQVRFVVMVMVAIASGVTVSSVGVISFVGLIAPHIAKKLAKSNFWQTVVLSVLTAIILLVFADLLARNLFKPYEFPAGSLTMLIGAPFFIWVISQEAK